MAIKKVMINKVLNKWGTTVMDLKIIPTILILIVLIASILIIPAESVSAADSSESKFKDTNVLNQPGGSLAGGIELGDPDDDGIDEVIVVGGSGEAGRVTVIDYNSSKGVLETPTIWVDSQALVDVVSADIDPFSDGEEIIVGGYSRNVTVLYWPGGLESASIKSIDSLPEQIFGLTAGELNDSHAGLELAVVDGKTTNLTIYQSGSAKDNWDKIVIPFNKTLRNVEAGDYDPAHAGDELILLASDGTVYSVIHNSGSWDVETVWQDVDSLLDAAIGDADPDTDGNEIVVVGLSWRATMLHKSASGVWNITELWKAPGGLEGIDIGEFDPSHAGFEIAMGGYSRTVVMMYREDDTWRNNVIYEDKESSQSELNGVVIGEFNPAHKDNEVMVVGASGVTTMLEYIYPDFTLSTVSETKTVTAGDNVVFTVEVNAVSSFSGMVELSVKSNLTWTLSSLTVDAPGTSSLTLFTDDSTLPKTYQTVVTGVHNSVSKTIELTVTVLPKDESDFALNLSVSLLDFNRLPDSKSDKFPTHTLTVKITGSSDFSELVEINATGLPEYFEAVKSTDSALPGESVQISIKLISNPGPDDNDFSFKITGRAGERIHVETVSIRLYPAAPVNGENDADSTRDQMRSILIAIIVILIIAILLLISIKYKAKPSVTDTKSDKASINKPRNTGNAECYKCGARVPRLAKKCPRCNTEFE